MVRYGLSDCSQNQARCIRSGGSSLDLTRRCGRQVGAPRLVRTRSLRQCTVSVLPRAPDNSVRTTPSCPEPRIALPSALDRSGPALLRRTGRGAPTCPQLKSRVGELLYSCRSTSKAGGLRGEDGPSSRRAGLFSSAGLQPSGRPSIRSSGQGQSAAAGGRRFAGKLPASGLPASRMPATSGQLPRSAELKKYYAVCVRSAPQVSWPGQLTSGGRQAARRQLPCSLSAACWLFARAPFTLWCHSCHQ